MGFIPESTKQQHSSCSAKGDNAELTKNAGHKISFIETFIHMLKGMLGIGIFTMGYCYMNGGLVGATVLLPIFALITVHCCHMLINASISAAKNTSDAITIGYPEAVQKTFELGPKPLRRFSNTMKLIVEVFLVATQFSFCSIYYVFVADNLHQVMLQNGFNISEGMVFLMTLLPIMIPSLLTNLKYISFVSLLANFALIFGLGATLTMAFETGGPMPSPADRDLITNGAQMSLFFGSAIFSFEGIALILPLRNSMREPEKFNSRFGVLNMIMLLVTCLYVLTGFVTYLRWGDEVEANVTLNLEVSLIISQVIKIVVALGVFFGYPIQMFILIKTLWKPIKKSNSFAQKSPILCEVLLRILVVLLTFGVALVVPQVGLFISLIGALCSTSLAFLIPVTVDFVLQSQQNPKGIDTFTYIKNSLIFAIGIIGLILGTYQSISEIIKGFSSKD